MKEQSHDVWCKSKLRDVLMWMVIGTQLKYVALPVCYFWVMRYFIMPQKKLRLTVVSGKKKKQTTVCGISELKCLHCSINLRGVMYLLLWAQAVPLPVDNPRSICTTWRISGKHRYSHSIREKEKQNKTPTTHTESCAQDGTDKYLVL